MPLLSIALAFLSIALAFLSVASAFLSVALISIRHLGSSFHRSCLSFRRSDFYPSPWLLLPFPLQ
ncbi:hypothetical protein [Lysinibacillus sp. TE18511]